MLDSLIPFARFPRSRSRSLAPALPQLTCPYFSGQTPSLCGNSVHSDKKHIDVQFPEFASRLDYRIIDVTSLKLLASAYRNVRYEKKSYQHYALQDISESVDELRFLLRELGISHLTEMATEVI